MSRGAGDGDARVVVAAGLVFDREFEAGAWLALDQDLRAGSPRLGHGFTKRPRHIALRIPTAQIPTEISSQRM